MEDNIYNGYIINYNILIDYGFIKNDNIYTYTKYILDNRFKVIVIINNDKLSSKVIDAKLNEEYINYKRNDIGEFNTKVKNEYISILLDIRNNCFIKKYFLFSQANKIASYLKKEFNDEPNYLWHDTPFYGVYKVNNKWYAIIMNIPKNKLEGTSSELVEIINIKLPKELIEELLKKKGYYRAYHMNKKHWISIILNDTISNEEVLNLIKKSRELVKG